ncbi:MAG: HipA domain-containing protein [Proteobacteria bacterium]|nr:HipA domain-containing protein [Pseudomonadota bacterium]
MTVNKGQSIQIHLDSPSASASLNVGALQIENIKGHEIFTFQFSEEALSHPHINLLFPNVAVSKGHFHLSHTENAALFKMLTDSMPDRWGKVLLKKKQLNEAKVSGTSKRMPDLNDSDYLLQLSDQTRMGAFRFYNPESEVYLGPNDQAIPPVSRVQELQEICCKVENDDAVGSWLEQLIAPGTSLGGARPKANMINEKGVLCIAKFPGKNDEIDVGLWEFITNRLAHQCNINVPDCDIDKFNSEYSTLLCERFDRNNQNERIHFVSAMALTQHNDGDEEASYLEIAEVIKQHGQDAAVNLHELWRRIVFNIAVSNGDDHLRNHGMLLQPEGWVLTPAYDVNPGSGKSGYLQLNIDDADNSADFDLALSSAEYFELDMTQAKAILKEVHISVTQWETSAKQQGASQNEIDIMQSAFQTEALAAHLEV